MKTASLCHSRFARVAVAVTMLLVAGGASADEAPSRDSDAAALQPAAGASAEMSAMDSSRDSNSRASIQSAIAIAKSGRSAEGADLVNELLAANASRESELREMFRTVTGVEATPRLDMARLGRLRVRHSEAIGVLEVVDPAVGSCTAPAAAPEVDNLSFEIYRADFGDMMKTFEQVSSVTIERQPCTFPGTPITLNVHDVSWDELLRRIVISQGLTCREQAGRLVIDCPE